MKKRMILTMAAVTCCLMAGSLTAHAVFKYSAHTGGISIQMASFSADYKVDFVKASGTSDMEEAVTLKENDWYEFPAYGTASFTVIPTGTASEGYVIVTIKTDGTEEAYCTGQLIKGENTFSITGKEGIKVKLEAKWGIYNAETEANAEIKPIEEGVIELVTEEELNNPTVLPSPSPEATVEPSARPTQEPTEQPTATPSPSPTAEPNPTPTVSPELSTELSPEPNTETSIEP